MLIVQTILLALSVMLGTAFLLRYWQRQSIEIALDVVWNVVNSIEQTTPHMHSREKHDVALSRSDIMLKHSLCWLPTGLIEAIIEDAVFKMPHAYKPFGTNPNMSKVQTRPIPVVQQKVPTVPLSVAPSDEFLNDNTKEEVHS